MCFTDLNRDNWLPKWVKLLALFFCLLNVHCSTVSRMYHNDNSHFSLTVFPLYFLLLLHFLCCDYSVDSYQRVVSGLFGKVSPGALSVFSAVAVNGLASLLAGRW